MADAGVETGDYMYVTGSDKPADMVDGAKYIVKLTDGTGFVYFGNTADMSKKVLYKVTKNGAVKMDSAFTTSDKAVSLRTAAPTGVRFRAMVANKLIAATVANDGFTVEEYGFLVSTGIMMSAPTEELNMAAVEAGKAKKGIAYGEGIECIYDVTDENVIITAVLTNIPDTADAYTTKLYVRPYVVLNGGTVIYGTPVTDTVHEIAYKLLESTTDESVIEFAEHVITVVEG